MPLWMDKPTKQVVVELTVTMLREVPADWDARLVESWLNDGSHCLGTEVRDLYESDNAEEHSCDSCDRIVARYIRDANPADIDNLKFREKNDA